MDPNGVGIGPLSKILAFKAVLEYAPLHNGWQIEIVVLSMHGQIWLLYNA